MKRTVTSDEKDKFKKGVIKMAFKKKSRGKKLSKLERSNRAHDRLAKKHLENWKTTRNKTFWVKNQYHWGCCHEQKKLDRLLTKAEKVSLFNYVKR